MKKPALAFALGALAGYLAWSRSGRAGHMDPSPLYLAAAESFGNDRKRGNLVGIQPYVEPRDYVSAERFHTKLNGYLAAAEGKGWLGDKTVVVLPEYVGTWLVLEGEKRGALTAPKVAAALSTVALSNLPQIARRLPFAPADDALRYSLFRMKADKMAATYHSVFSALACRYAVTIVAGSILLPAPEVREGRLVVNSGPLYNVSVVYRPTGRPHDQIVRKVYPVPEEAAFVTPGNEADLPVFETPAGRLGVLVCADAWFPGPYGVLRQQGAEIIAVPSYAFPDDHWREPWGGYQANAPTPGDAAVPGQLTAGQAWLKYALPGRIGAAGAHAGVNVFLRGWLWDLGSDGHTIMVRRSKVFEGAHVEGAAITNMWL